MTAAAVYSQARALIDRLVETGLSIRQFYPVLQQSADGSATVGSLGGSISVALRDVEYQRVYHELDVGDCYHVKLPDGALMCFQYTFAPDGKLVKHRLAFFPPSALPTVEEAPALYENDELYAEILMSRLVRFPIRFDFDPGNAREVLHPCSHLTLGQFENCRIPVSHPMTPGTFSRFIIRNFYHHSYIKNKNKMEQRLPRVQFECCVTQLERRIPYVSVFETNA